MDIKVFVMIGEEGILMFKFENLEELKNFLANELLLTNEATEYLGISSQRLHQLVQSGKIIPVKTNKSSSIFLKTELYERKFEIEKNYQKHLNRNKLMKNSVEIINEAIIYFACLSIFNNSYKKWDPIYDHLSTQIDFTLEPHQIADELCNIVGIEKDQFIAECQTVRKSFDLLKPDDLIVKIGTENYPEILAQTEQAPRFLFMRGNVNLLKFNAISIVGTRNPSENGILRARTLAERLGKHRIVVASGLAKGIDTAAHKGALKNNNPTIAVIGTPLNKVYPKENKELQELIAEKGLIISQFAPSMNVQRWNFPMRNAVMSGISLATVIIEAGETSGSLIQADYALKQGRIVMIPQSAIDNEKLSWPKKYLKRKGAFKFSNISELLMTIGENLKNPLFSQLQYDSQEKLPLSEGTIAYVHNDKVD